MRGIEMAVRVLDEMQVFDEQVAPARAISKQSPYLTAGGGIYQTTAETAFACDLGHCSGFREKYFTLATTPPVANHAAHPAEAAQGASMTWIQGFKVPHEQRDE